MRKIYNKVREILEMDSFVAANSSASNLDTKLHLQLVAAAAFILLSITNIFSKSYFMLVFTLSGGIMNGVSALYAKKFRKSRLCSISSIATCSVLFGFFVIYGGNDGFSCLWVTLLPFLAMVVMDFIVGFCASLFFQIFLMIVFWTPVRDMLFYQYNEQFCLRFPMFFFVTFVLGLALTISFKKSQYNECRQRLELEEMTETAHKLARLDSLTELSNRRGAYEEFSAGFSERGVPHCLVMCDIDHFKWVNDTYGHEYGDDILIELAKIIKERLPSEYFKARWGGEEFLFAANEPQNAVYEEVEALRRYIADHEFHIGATPLHITLTFGIAEYEDGDGIIDALNKADRRLYNGKKAQRNCTVVDG